MQDRGRGKERMVSDGDRRNPARSVDLLARAKPGSGNRQASPHSGARLVYDSIAAQVSPPSAFS